MVVFVAIWRLNPLTAGGGREAPRFARGQCASSFRPLPAENGEAARQMAGEGLLVAGLQTSLAKKQKVELKLVYFSVKCDFLKAKKPPH